MKACRRASASASVSLLLMGLFGYALHQSGFFSGWRELPDTLMWKYAFGFLCCMTFQHMCRVMRWKIVLAPFDVRNWRSILYASSIGFAGVLLLPLRSGEFIRPYLIRTKTFNMTNALGGIFLERVVDLLLLSAAMLTTLLLRSRLIPIPGWLFGISAMCVVGVLGLAVIIFIFVKTRVGAKVADSLAKITQAQQDNSRVRKVAATIATAVLNLRLGIQPVFRILTMSKLILWSAAYWMANAASLVFLSKLLSLDTVGLLAGICNVATVGIGVMVPAGPAMAGSWEFFSKISLELYGSENYTPFILLSHGLNIVWYALICAITWLVYNATRSDARINN